MDSHCLAVQQWDKGDGKLQNKYEANGNMLEKEQIVVFLGQVTDSDQASLSIRTMKLKTKGQLIF